MALLFDQNQAIPFKAETFRPLRSALNRWRKPLSPAPRLDLPPAHREQHFSPGPKLRAKRNNPEFFLFKSMVALIDMHSKLTFEQQLKVHSSKIKSKSFHGYLQGPARPKKSASFLRRQHEYTSLLKTRNAFFEHKLQPSKDIPFRVKRKVNRRPEPQCSPVLIKL